MYMVDLKLVSCEKKYWDFIRVLRNCNIGFVEQVNITSDQQNTYMSKYNQFYWIGLKDDIPVGFVGHIEGDIRIAVDPDYQNCGIGSFLLNEFIKLNPDTFAKVKIGNEASIRLFEKCGFKKKFYLMEKS
jgi:ribosomal protein S18 acetylase RimI-like enzyme